MAYNDGYKGHKDSVKVWVELRMDTHTVLSSYNVSSITDQSTGYCLVNYATNLLDNDHACFASCDPRGSSKNYAHGARSGASNYGRLYIEDSDGNGYDANPACFLVIGT